MMRTEKLKFIVFPLVIILLIWTLSCSGRPEQGLKIDEAPSTPVVAEKAETYIKLLKPEKNTEYKLNEPVKVLLEVSDNKRIPDSVQISYDGKQVKTLISAPWEFSISPASTVGRKSLRITAFRNGKSQNPITRIMIVYSDVVPKRQRYKVLNVYPHDPQAFTQGLIFDNGILFESTGQNSESSLREVDLVTGKVIRQLNLESSLFGEGITLWRDHLYHVTWTSKVGFIYEKSTFKMVNKIYYQTQGWGLTTIDDKIVMSDGTNVLGFYEPQSFTEVRRLEVYDNERKVDSLNELEYIDGEIWANIWMTDLIARIDPESGKVNSYIDLKGLLPESERRLNTNVLNGIAYDKAGKRVFVTGKNWPKLYEIAVIQ